MESTTARALTTTVGRRSFLKMAALGSVFGATSGFASEKVTRAATEEEVKDPFYQYIHYHQLLLHLDSPI